MNEILKGVIKSAAQMQGELQESQNMSGALSRILPTNYYDGNYTIDPTSTSQTLDVVGKTMINNVTVTPIPSEYIIPSGTIEITSNGTEDVTQYASASVNVQPSLQSKSATASSAGDLTLTPDEGYDGLLQATVTVPSGSASQGTQFGYTSSGTRWRMRGYNNVTSAGWFESGQTQGAWASFYAIPSGTVITPTESSQTVGGDDYMMQGAVTVSPIPSEYIIPSGTIEIEDGGENNVAGYETADVPYGSLFAGYDSSYVTSNGVKKWRVRGNATVGTGWLHAQHAYGEYDYYDVVPSGTTVTPSTLAQTIGGSNYMMEDGVEVYPIPADFVGTDVPRRTSSDMYGTSDYKVGAPSGYYESDALFQVPYETHTAPSISYNSSGLITATHYQPSETLCIGSDTTSNSLQIASASIGASYTASYSSFYDPYTQEYAFTWDITPTANVTSDGWVSVGSYGAGTQMYLAIPSGTVVTPSTSSQTIGWENTMLQSAVTVSPIPSQYIVPSGTISISSNGTVDVTQYASASISVPTGTPTLQTKTYTVSNYGSVDITPSAGYDGLSKVTVTTPSGSAKPASSISSSDGATITTETGKIVLSKSVNNVPQVTAGYISAGTFGDTSVTLRATCSINGNSALSQSGSTVTALAGYYPSNATLTVSGGSSKNVQVLQSTSRTNASSLTKVLGDLTVSKTGKYDIYWSGGRTNTSTSYTWGTRLYVNGTGYGTENTSWSNNVQSNHLTNVSLTANQKLSVYARGRTGSYYTFVPMLVIVEV